MNQSKPLLFVGLTTLLAIGLMMALAPKEKHEKEKLAIDSNLKTENTTEQKDKINGLCFVAPPKPINETSIKYVDSVGANWLCLMPYSFCPADEPKVLWNHKWQWWGETGEGLIKTIELAHGDGKKVMVKPHVWRRHGLFTGDIDFETDAEWESWENDYSRYVIRCAQVADSLNAEVFCFGTELKNPIKSRPKYWLELIDTLKKIYQGQLTYAANWDNYEKIPFWNKLDYIGIDAYFPLSSAKTPSTEEILQVWAPIKINIAALQSKMELPVIFTEFGYRSVDYSTKEPYNSSNSETINETAQANALDALMKTFWPETWFHGGFVWKWYADHHNNSGKKSDYTPQNKKAQQIIKKHYSFGG